MMSEKAKEGFMLHTFTQIDGQLLINIQTFCIHDVLTPIVVFMTHLGDMGFIWIVLSIILLIPKKTRRTGLLALIALVITFLIGNVVLKNWIARPRPYEVFEDVRRLIEAQSDYSFPSGHTSASFAVGVVYCRTLPIGYGILAMILAVSISLSRLYVGVHYPSDVLGGALLGTLVALLVCAVDARRQSKKEIGRAHV